MIYVLIIFVLVVSCILYIFNKKQLYHVSNKWDEFSDRISKSDD